MGIMDRRENFKVQDENVTFEELLENAPDEIVKLVEKANGWRFRRVDSALGR